ncbi:MAG TPA: O-sialoglycoprotein endopeptidase [Limnochordia bacterium]|jgi:N6-L-threonylcarbamoyladenine synthase|nr:O-sialoglycoprotein endopeptidase [Limnochordia bacterium]
MRVFLGIDTSSYTTSLCLLGEDGTIKADERMILQVASGARGLRQSEALFQHVQNIPEITSRLSPRLEGHDLAAIGVSVKPRPQDDSYLPVFLPGLALGEALGNLLGIPCHKLTHQETHIWSGVASAGGPKSEDFLAIHLSGGTTELTSVRRAKTTHELQIESLGRTLDLHAGQFVDRLGVKMGLSFPAGPALEKLAHLTKETVPVATFHRAGMVSFSGPLTALEKNVGEVSPEVCARTCFAAIARTLVKWIRWAGDTYPSRELLIVGGVAANQIIRDTLCAQLPNWSLYFAAPVYSVDNAYGAAFYSFLASGKVGEDYVATHFSQ